MTRVASVFVVSLSTTGLMGCQTPPRKAFEEIKPGMDKSIVVETVGGPKISRRWQGKDRWIYEFHDRSGESEIKEVHFENGRAVYVGPKVLPKVSAAEQDRINEALVTEDTRQTRTLLEQRAEMLATPRLGEVPSENSADAQLYRKLLDSMYGREPAPVDESRKQPMNFVPVE